MYVYIENFLHHTSSILSIQIHNTKFYLRPLVSFFSCDHIQQRLFSCCAPTMFRYNLKVPRIIWHTALYVQRIREIIFFTLHNRNFLLILIIFPDPEMIEFRLKTLDIQLFHKIFPVLMFLKNFEFSR